MTSKLANAFSHGKCADGIHIGRNDWYTMPGSLRVTKAKFTMY